MLSKILRGAVLATFAVGATVAQAGPFNGGDTGELRYKNMAPGSAYATIVPSQSPANSNAATAGLMGGYFDNTSPYADDAANFFYFFCIDLGHIALGTYSAYTRTDATGLTSGDIAQLENLFDRYVNADAMNLGTVEGSPNVSATNSAAMQLAIWNIIYDNDLTVDAHSGALFSSVSTPSTASSLANTMLSFVNSPVASNQQYTYNFFRYNSDLADTTTAVSRYSQDYLAFERNRQPRGDVPLPGTLALLGIGLAGLGLARRKG